MPHYAFRGSDASGHAQVVSVELPDLASARLEAVRSMGEQLRDDPGAAALGAEPLSVTVLDEEGRTLFTIVALGYGRDGPPLTNQTVSA